MSTVKNENKQNDLPKLGSYPLLINYNHGKYFLRWTRNSNCKNTFDTIQSVETAQKDIGGG